MVLIRSVLVPLFLALFLGACSGSDGFGVGSGSTDSGGGSAGEDSTDTGSDDSSDDSSGSATLALGTGSGGSFTSGSLTTTIPAGTDLSFGGSTTLTVNVVDTSSSNSLVQSPTAVTFTSTCAAAGLATFGQSATQTASANTVNGTATMSYSATSCQGSDTVTASLASGDSATVTFGISSLALGTGTGGSFVSGGMTTTLGGADLSYGGDTAISVNIVDTNDNSLFTDSPVTVNFTSNCVQSGLSNIDTSVIATDGTATAAYSAVTCEGNDTVTATLQDGTTATTNITVASQVLGSLEFVSATPTTIALKGSGSSANPEVSQLIFVLRDNTGSPIQGETINYTLSTTAGGITLSSASSVTASDGTTSITLNAGTIPISVSVAATITDSGGSTIKTNSKPIAIVGGIPDQNSFSISVETFNPRGFDIDGTTSAITIRAADRYNNPAPDSTQISFVTDGGSIVGSCSLSGGLCAVNWTSQDPRPSDGLVHVLARTTGEESFQDDNANGQYDVGETVLTHLDEAFNDENGNGVKDTGEFFSDFNEDGLFTTKSNTLFQGTNCTAAAETAGHCATLVDVRESATLCMSTDFVGISDNQGQAFSISGDGPNVNITLVDGNGLTPANGTTVSVTAEDLKIIAGGTQVIPNECVVGGYTFTVTVGPDDDAGTVAGTLKISVTQANGIVREWPILVAD